MKIIFIKNILFLALIFIFFNCKEVSLTEDVELQTLKSWMTGSFSSRLQAERDTNFFNIHLKMKQIWKQRNDAIWLYVEQGAAWSLDKPYRQRVYRLTRTDNATLESAVFSLENPLRFAGVWKEDQPLNQLTPDSLTERTGCAITLEYTDGAFVGSTYLKNCVSQLRGAAYATSEVRIEENLLTSWDRGFDENDLQVWGSEVGSYVFKKLKDFD
ncbi:chromophore lyase CpcT/CpeT [Bacteroidota bacterium]